FIEFMACPGGCLGGGGQPYNISENIRIQRMEGLYQDDRDRELRFAHENPAIKKLYRDFLGEPMGPKAHELLHTTYTARRKYKR
ncbi:MAG: iron hydrogenase small subunit, partial [bacterium]